MIIVEIMAGLGNQLFQYANAYSLSKSLKKDLRLDLSFFERSHRKDVFRLDKFNIVFEEAEINDIARLKRKVLKPDILRKIGRSIGIVPYSNFKYHFDNDRIDDCLINNRNYASEMYVSGYFADEKYFKKFEIDLRKQFVLKKSLNSSNLKMLNRIENSNSISVHIRRGDYVGNSFFAEIPITYYQEAIRYIEERVNNITLFIFSDDLEWAKNNFVTKNKTVFVGINDSATDYMELALMAACKHNIIANSTFSWWGAWLNNNFNKIVIAPKVWFNDKSSQSKYSNGGLVPSEWLKI